MGQICSKRRNFVIDKQAISLYPPFPFLNYLSLKILLSPKSVMLWQRDQPKCLKLQYTESYVDDTSLSQSGMKTLTKNPLKHIKEVSLILQNRKMNLKRSGEVLKKSSSLTRIKMLINEDKSLSISFRFKWVNSPHITYLWTGFKRLKSLEITITRKMVKDVAKLLERCVHLENIVIKIFGEDCQKEDFTILGKSLEKLGKLERFMILGFDARRWNETDKKENWIASFLKNVKKVELLKGAKLGYKVRGALKMHFQRLYLHGLELTFKPVFIKR